MSDDDEDYEDAGLSRSNTNGSSSGKKKTLKKNKTVEEIYTKKTQLEHILLRPDTYIGSVEKHTQPMWVLDAESKKIVNRPCTFVPGLYKIFDEILVNAADNKQRDPTMSKIEVVIDREKGFISIFNNGKSIPVAIHKVHNVYVPELVFGHLLTGSNFDDEEEKTTGGRNGYGAKLANIFSKKFVIEVGDTTNNLHYKQDFSNNMTKIHPPRVTKLTTGKDFTKVTFYPDFAKFHMSSFNDDDIVDLLSKRVYDIAGCCNITRGAKLKVLLNKDKIEIKKFEDYILLYQGLEPLVAYERLNERWEIAVGPSDGNFQQVSFVNSICTSKGGTHVNYVVDQITSRLIQTIKRKSKNELKANQIKSHLIVYVNCLIINPAFDSQTKEFMTTKSSSFGSTGVLSERIFRLVEKSTIIDNILSWTKMKQTMELKKKSGSKRSKLIGITKLDDANYAGTAKSSKCTLILTEGDSAKALAISGLGVVGRDYYGVFPLKGKLLNVRDASHQQIMKNEEIQNITKILGLTYGKVYTDASSLRYGHLMIMTDQDHDGSHIKGLLINYIHYFWPSLLQIPDFLQQFITPIVKCFKGKEEISFYTLPEYQQWKTANQDGKGWRIKYYKGLGTSTAQEAKKYFSHLSIHKLPFQWDDLANDMIDLAFAKKRVDDRKLWLLALKPGLFIDYNKKRITYNNFINHELILFSHADNERSIAHFMDGLKPSQRKVLFSCFKRNLVNEIKVAQLAGYISEHSAYHHGEASLTQTIIGMAQNFVGSNNINLLSPCGQFGTRLMGGKDAASPRYVFTKLEEITRLIFHPDDDNLLDYLEEDGQSIEPTYYVPIIPMALVNGSEGIGTGWSSTVPNYNPLEIIENLKKMIAGEEPSEMNPWYRGFVGNITAKDGKNTNFSVTGLADFLDEQTIQISELPVGKWTTDYKQFLESALIGNTPPPNANNNAGNKGEDGNTAGSAFVKDFKENHTDTTVLFTISCPPDKLADFENEKGGLIKKFKLETSISTTNMNLFDINGQIKKYESALNVMKDFFPVRLDLYKRRRNALCQRLEKEWKMLENKMRFIKEIIDGKLTINNRRKKDIFNELQRRNYELFPPDNNNQNDNNEDGDDDQAEFTNAELQRGYDYLLNLKLWNLTSEKIQELREQRDRKRDELEALKAKSPEQLWLDDLLRLEEMIKVLFSNSPDEEYRRKQLMKRKSIKPIISKQNPAVIGGEVVVSSAKKSSTKKKKVDDSEDDDDGDEDDAASWNFDGSDDDDIGNFIVDPEKLIKSSSKKTKAPPKPKTPATTMVASPKKSSTKLVKNSSTKSKKKKRSSDEEEDDDNDEDEDISWGESDSESETSDDDGTSSSHSDEESVYEEKSKPSLTSPLSNRPRRSVTLNKSNSSRLNLDSDEDKDKEEGDDAAMEIDDGSVPPKKKAPAATSSKKRKSTTSDPLDLMSNDEGHGQDMKRQGSNATTTTISTISTHPTPDKNATANSLLSSSKRSIAPISSLKKKIEDDWFSDDVVILTSPNKTATHSNSNLLANTSSSFFKPPAPAATTTTAKSTTNISVIEDDTPVPKKARIESTNGPSPSSSTLVDLTQNTLTDFSRKSTGVSNLPLSQSSQSRPSRASRGSGVNYNQFFNDEEDDKDEDDIFADSDDDEGNKLKKRKSIGTTSSSSTAAGKKKTTTIAAATVKKPSSSSASKKSAVIDLSDDEDDDDDEDFDEENKKKKKSTNARTSKSSESAVKKKKSATVTSSSAAKGTKKPSAKKKTKKSFASSDEDDEDDFENSDDSDYSD